jgi:hypothetical protein
MPSLQVLNRLPQLLPEVLNEQVLPKVLSEQVLSKVLSERHMSIATLVTMLLHTIATISMARIILQLVVRPIHITITSLTIPLAVLEP